MVRTVREAKTTCLCSECTDKCTLRALCELTAFYGPTLEMWYDNMQYPDDKPVREVIEENIAEHERFLEGLRRLTDIYE